MAEIAKIDGEDAGTTPWEFDSLTEEGTTEFSLQETAKHEGSYGYKMTGDGTNDGINGIKTVSDLSELYCRAYVYIPSGITDANGGEVSNYLPLLSFHDGNDAIHVIGVRFQGAASQGWYIWNLMEDAYDESATNWSEDAWHYVELYADLDSEGHFTAWVDGSQVDTHAPGDASVFAIDKVVVGSHAHTGGNVIVANGDYVYFDDIVLSTTGPIGAYEVPIGDKKVMVIL